MITRIASDGSATYDRQATFAAGLIMTSSLRLKSFTVATLPAGTEGDLAYVVDALAPTFLTAIVGGGAIKTPVFYNGTGWVAF